jgi:hypothetical protein
MDAALAEALSPVLRDLASSGSVIPEVRDDRWAGVEGLETGVLRSPDGSGQGVSVMTGESLPQRIASVADQVQEWAVEELCSVGRPTNWPQCPQHRSSHPPSAVVRDGRAVWACPATGRPISETGRLGRAQR